MLYKLMNTKYSNQTMPNMTPSQSICCIILSLNIIRDTINNKDMRTTWYNSKVFDMGHF